MNDPRYLITDPVEIVIANTLHSRVNYTIEGENGQRIDFMVDGIAIECKRMHAPRIIEQMAPHENYIIICGMDAAKLVEKLCNGK